MSMIEAARQLRKLIELNAGNLTDEQAASLPYCFPVWEEGMEVKEGERYAVRVNNSVATLSVDDEENTTESEELVLCKCMKSHTTTIDKAPEEAPELWEVLERR